MTVFGTNIDRKKAALSLALGLAATAGTIFSFDFAFPPHHVTVIWSLFLPMVAALAYGWRYALIAATLGGVSFISFVLWPTNGWANVLIVIFFGGWYVWQGYCVDRRRRKSSWWNNVYGAQALYAVFYNVLFFAVFPVLFRFNPPFWYPDAALSMPLSVIAGIAIKETFMMFAGVYVSDVLLHVPAVRRFFGLPVSASMRYHARILLSSILVSIAVAASLLLLEGFLFDHNITILFRKSTDEIVSFAVLIIMLSSAAGLQVAIYMEKRIDAEDALRASEEWFSAIFASVNDAIFIHDLISGAIVDVNNKMCDMFGYSRSEALISSVGTLSAGVAPYTQEDAMTKIRQSAAGESQLFEWLCRHKKGHLFWGEVNMKHAAIGGAERVIVTIRDITERKQAAEKLMEREHLYRTLFESANDAIFLIRDDRFVDCNSRALQMFGCSREEIIGKSLYDFSPQMQAGSKDSRVETQRLMNAALQGDPQIFEWVYYNGKGDTFNAEVSLNKVSLSSGTHIQAIVRNITERKNAEQAIMREKAFSDAIIDSLPGVFYICDQEGNLLRWNNNEKETTGYSMAELSHMNVKNLFGADRDLIERKIQEVLEIGRTVLEASIITKSGVPIPFYLTGCRMSLDGRQYIVGIGLDISDRKQLENQLRHSQKMEAIGTLAGGVAHDFNNILSAIIGYGNIIQLRLPPDDPLRLNVDHMLESAERGAQLTHSLLAFSRKQVMNLKPVKLNEIIERIDKFLRRIIGEDVELRTNLNGDPTVLADSSQIEQVMMNLATNARDAMPKGGSLAIETDVAELPDAEARALELEAAGTYALISVTDSGNGMDEETRKKIFEPFFTTKEMGRGTGLGLAIIYGIVKQHHGCINVYSQPDRGTTFKIYLPLHKGCVEFCAPATKPALVVGGTETILLAEDDPSLRTFFAGVMEEFGYTVVRAEDGIDAIEQFKKHRYTIQLCIMDMIMPRKGGREIYEEIHRLRPDIKVIFISGYTADKIESEGIPAGCEFVQKPVSPQVLLKRIRDALDRKPEKRLISA
jgi:two-component system cell cycle sensor histidine kinase/response regulator CckA